MGTKDFNLVDKIIAGWRLAKITGRINKGDKVLDIGCGSQGYFLNLIGEKIKLGYGLDADTEDKIEGNLVFRKFRFESKLPEGIGTFDKIVMLAVLEHIEIERVNTLFSEFKKSLNKNGQIILTTPTPMSKPLLELLANLKIINLAEIKDHKKYYGKMDIQKIAIDNGLKLVSYNLFQLGLNCVAVFEKN